jgi:hypothetical protein
MESGAADLPDFSDIRLVDVYLHHAESEIFDGRENFLRGKILVGCWSHGLVSRQD